MTPTKIAFPSDEGDEDEVRRLVDAGVDVNHGHRPSFLGAYFNGYDEQRDQIPSFIF
jgi:hypothetical protein